MSDTDAMRSTAPPRPPFPGGISSQRPGMMQAGPPPRSAGPMPPQNPNLIRAMPPPLRNMDSRSNMNMGPGPPPGSPGIRPPPPTGAAAMQQQQMRPLNDSGTLNQLGQRPQGAPYLPAQQNRPQNPYAVNMQGRPPFQRPPGAALGSPTAGQAPQLPRPAFIPQPQSGQPMQQQVPPKQLPKQALSIQRPPSSSSNYNDEDDVVIGQAMTPVKSLLTKQESKSLPIRDDIEPPFKNSTVIEVSTTEPKKPASVYKPMVTTLSNRIGVFLLLLIHI